MPVFSDVDSMGVGFWMGHGAVEKIADGPANRCQYTQNPCKWQWFAI